MKKHYIIITILSLILLALLLTGCHSSKVTNESNIGHAGIENPIIGHTADSMQTIRIKYDSVYITHEQTMDFRPSADRFRPYSDLFRPQQEEFPTNPDRFRPDTLLIQVNNTEYRFRLIHDTLQVHQVDTIPIVKTVEVIREVRHTPKLTQWLAYIGLFALLMVLIKIIQWIKAIV